MLNLSLKMNNENFIKEITKLKNTPFRLKVLTVFLVFMVFLVWYNHGNNNREVAMKVQAVIGYDLVSNPEERIQQFYNGIIEKKS